jgi:hypothetical protein
MARIEMSGGGACRFRDKLVGHSDGHLGINADAANYITLNSPKP